MSSEYPYLEVRGKEGKEGKGGKGAERGTENTSREPSHSKLGLSEETMVSLTNGVMRKHAYKRCLQAGYTNGSAQQRTRLHRLLS